MRKAAIIAAIAVLAAAPASAYNAELERLMIEYAGGNAPAVSSSDNRQRQPSIQLAGLEGRVASVVRTEMGPKWPLEALKAQAVLARTYILYSSGIRQLAPAEPSTGKTETAVLTGEAIAMAVRETEGEVVAYNGAVAQVFYCSDSGGITASSESVWGKAIPYLIPINDPVPSNSPVSRWQLSFTLSELSAKLEAAGAGAGKLTSVQIAARDESGRVQKLEITGSSGTRVITGAKFRAALGSAAVKSTLFELSGAAADSQPAAAIPDSQPPVQSEIQTSEQKYPSPDRSTMPEGKEDKLVWMAKHKVFTTMELMSMIGKSKEYDRFLAEGEARMSGSKKRIVNFQKPAVAALQPRPVQQRQMEETTRAGVIVISGRGYGHGVGMPQWCAKVLAESGWDHKQIINCYFPGTTIEKGKY